jgi:hypothetical protein
MTKTLHSLAPAARRLVLVCYANQHPEVMREVAARLRDPQWVPTPEDCPVDWRTLTRWYAGLQRTGQIVMDSY